MATYYPEARSFHFRVEIKGITSDGGQSTIHCQKVSGLSMDITEKAFYEGGENTFQHKIPEPVKFGALSLTRAMVTQPSELIEWVKDALQNFSFSPRDISVILMNSQHQPLQSWNFVNCWPKKMGISDFDAQASQGLVIETLDFNYQYFYRT